MPLIIKRQPASPPPKRGSRGRHFDAFLTEIAPVILDMQQKKVRKLEELVDALNSMGVLNSKGKPWSKSNMRNALMRGRELGITEGPQTLSEAGSNRKYTRRTGRAWKPFSPKQKEGWQKLSEAFPSDSPAE
jgi:hypothetical protein